MDSNFRIGICSYPVTHFHGIEKKGTHTPYGSDEEKHNFRKS